MCESERWRITSGGGLPALAAPLPPLSAVEPPPTPPFQLRSKPTCAEYESC